MNASAFTKCDPRDCLTQTFSEFGPRPGMSGSPRGGIVDARLEHAVIPRRRAAHRVSAPLGDSFWLDGAVRREPLARVCAGVTAREHVSGVARDHPYRGHRIGRVSHVWLFISDSEEVHEVRLIDYAGSQRDLTWDVAPVLKVDGDPLMEQIVSSDEPDRKSVV